MRFNHLGLRIPLKRTALADVLPAWFLSCLNDNGYLSHMIVVFALVRVYRLAGGDVRWGFLWYLLALPLCWLLGTLIEHWLSAPCERWLRARLTRSSLVDAVTMAPAGQGGTPP